MKKSNLYTIKIPPVTREYALSLDARFPVKPIDPEMGLAEIQYYAGMRKVVESVLNDVQKESFLNRP